MRSDPGLVERIAAQPEEPEHRLACAEWFVTDADVEQIAESEVLQSLERLELAHNELTPEGVLVFRSPQPLSRERVHLRRGESRVRKQPSLQQPRFREHPP